jgi:hypothetical protein
VLESPGDLGGGIVVQTPAAKVLPSGYQLASEFLPPGQGSGQQYHPGSTAKHCKKHKRGKHHRAAAAKKCKKHKRHKKHRH